MSSSAETESPDDVCAHLGLAEDAESHATYATDAHRCFRLEKPTRIAPNHQERYCLVANHTQCPIYQGEGISATLGATPAGATPPAADPIPVASARLDRPGARPPQPRGGTERPASAGPRPRPGGIPMSTMTIGIFIIAALILALSFWLVTRGGDDDDTLGANPTETETATSQTTTTPSTATTPTGSPSPGSTVTTTGTPGTPTQGGGGGTYTVVDGDTCEGIAVAHGIELEDFYAANPDIAADCSNLQVDQEVVIP